MIFSLIFGSLALVIGCVTARANLFPTSLIARHSALSTNDCNTTCTNFHDLHSKCTTSHCGCNVPFVQAKGDCLVCLTSTPQDAAAVQFLLDSEMTKCQKEGFNVQFQLKLYPAAAAIVQKFNRESAFLRRSQTAFLALQISGGHIGLVIALAFAVFSREIRRDPTFLNFCITWIFSSIVFSILLYRGNDGNNTADPLGIVPPNRCLAQAALTEGAQVMTACSTLALVVQLWLSLRTTLYGVPLNDPKRTKWMTCALLVTPYLLFIGFALPSVLVGINRVVVKGITLQRVIPTNFYCVMIQLNPFLQAVYGVTLGLLLITVGFDVLIISILYRHWWAFRHVETKSAVSLSLLLRVMVFSIYRVVVAVAFGTVIIRPPTVNATGQGQSLAIFFSIPIWVDMLQATIPLVGFLVLGINRDMIDSLMFWCGEAATTGISNTRFSTINGRRSSMTNREISILEAETKFVPVLDWIPRQPGNYVE